MSNLSKQIQHAFIPMIRYWGKRKMNKKFDKPPVIIGGCARSGTTLLKSVLSAHPALFVFPYEIAAFNTWETTADGQQIPTRIDKLYRESLRYPVPPTAKRWCSKAPSNIHNIPQILGYFNNEVRFIHLVRDVRDVVLSRHPKDKNNYWVKPERWLHDVKAGWEYHTHPSVHTLRYEDLILDYRSTIKKLCEFIGIPMTQELLNWHENTGIKKSNAVFGEIGDFYKSSIGKWKAPEHRAYIERIMAQPDITAMLQNYGYDTQA